MSLRGIEDEAQFITRMRNRRAGLRWSQHELAQRIREAGLEGFHQTTVSKLEKGERPLRLNEARVIAEVLDSAVPTRRGAAMPDTPDARKPEVAPPAVTRELLTLQEVADWTRTPVATLRYWRHCGTGPKSANLGGRRVVYRRADVQAWIDGQFDQS